MTPDLPGQSEHLAGQSWDAQAGCHQPRLSGLKWWGFQHLYNIYFGDFRIELDPLLKTTTTKNTYNLS